MVLNRFFIVVLIRVIFLVLSCIALGIAMQHLHAGYYYTLTGIFILIILQTGLLVHHVNKTNEDLEKFFSSVHDHDSSIRFQKYAGNHSFGKLHDNMNHLNAIIQQTKIEQERIGNFLQNIVDHIDIGLLSFDDTGKIEIYNRAVKKYFQIQHPRQISILKSRNNALFDIIYSIKPGQEILHKTTVDHLLQSILIKSVVFKFDDHTIKLVSFQNITNELDKKELDSWQKLIRVLTHEIMNSISPITSLTSVISGYFKNEDSKNPEKVTDQIISKTLHGLNTIEETGKGLLDFVDKYRSLTLLPQPELTKLLIENLFSRCKVLMESYLPDHIKITTTIYPDDLTLVADSAQIEQVLINLVKNAFEAIDVNENGSIQLKAYCGEDCTIIQVEDNGTGIPDDIIDDIFVPFYTTKENGSGIGLSLSKQIMQNHQGTISVNSASTRGAIFTLIFPINRND